MRNPTQVIEAVEREGKSSQFVEMKALQLLLESAEQEKWPALCLYTDSWMVAHALWGWLQQWKKTSSQCRGKVIGAAALQQDITTQAENMTLKEHQVVAHMPKSHGTEEYLNNEQADKIAKTAITKVDID